MSDQSNLSLSEQEFVEVTGGFFVDAEYVKAFEQFGFVSIESVFDFKAGDVLAKMNMAKHRSRVRFTLEGLERAFYLKRYDEPSIVLQLRNWIGHGRRASMSAFDMAWTDELAKAGINVPKTIAYGAQWGKVFERRSFIITEEIATGVSLEQKLPGVFYEICRGEQLKERIAFIEKLADFARRFHETGLRHRDFYLAHIFLTEDQELYLIDLQRLFGPKLKPISERFRVKDIAQLYYSSPGQFISRADRLRFFLRYTARDKVSKADRRFIRRVKARAWRMADHDIKHGRDVPFAM